MKRCLLCGLLKPEGNYHKNKQRKDGLNPICKPCNIAKARAWEISNPERAEERRRRWRENNREKHRRSALKYYYSHHEVEKEKSRTRSKSAGFREYKKEYNKLHPEKHKEYDHARRSRKKGKFTGREWLSLLEQYGNMCLCCKSIDKKLVPDHIVPLSRGGINVIENIQPLCETCNKKKFTKTTDYRPSGHPIPVQRAG